MKSRNVEETEWWIGDIFILMCENKEIIDPKIYQKIVDLKNELASNKSKILFFHTLFKNSKVLEEKFNETITYVDTRIAENKLYLRAIKTVESENIQE